MRFCIKGNINMTLYFAKKSDILIPINTENGMLLNQTERDFIAKALYGKYLDGKIVNSARCLSSCPVCKGYCSYFTGESHIYLGRCAILEERSEYNIVIPVELIHILQKHDSFVDNRLIDHFGWRQSAESNKV